MARQPIPRLGPADRLQVQAAPVNSYVQPAEATGGADLLRALSSFTPALGEFADRMAADGRAKAEAAVEGKIGGMTFDEFKAARSADPAMGFTGPWARAALDKQFGTRLGHEVRRSVETELAQADPLTADADEITARHVEEAQASIGGSKFTVAGFQSITSGLADKAKDVLNGKRIAATVETRNDNAQQNMLGVVEMYSEENLPVRELTQHLGAMIDQNAEMLGIPKREQAKLLTDVMATMAQRPDMRDAVEAIGEMEIDGIALSTTLGARYEALVLTAEAATMKKQKDDLTPEIERFYADSAAGTLDEASFNSRMDGLNKILGPSFRASMLERNKAAQERQLAGAVAAVNAEAEKTVITEITPGLIELARKGIIAEAKAVTMKVGTRTIEISADKAREIGLQGAAAEIAAEGKAQGLPDDQIRRNQLSMYGGGGQLDPVAEQRLSALAFSTATAGDIPPALLAYIPELMAVQSAAPFMVARIVKNEQQQLLLDTITTGVELGMSEADALRQALWRRDNKQLIALPTGKERSAAISNITGKLDKGTGNPAMLADIVNDRFDYFYATGATGDKLNQKVVDSFYQTHAELNGYLVDVSGVGMGPGKALPVLTDAADAIKEANNLPKNARITMIPLQRGGTSFMAVDALGQQIKGSTRQWSELQALHTERLAFRLRQAPAKGARREEMRANTWVGGIN